MKEERHAAILGLVRASRLHSQEELRRLLGDRGFSVTQATLSRDLRELRVAKVPGVGSESYYAPAPEAIGERPDLGSILPQLMVGVEGVGNLIVLKTVTGAAQVVAEAIDLEDWPEAMGTIAGDDTILMVVRDERQLKPLVGRIRGIASG